MDVLVESFSIYIFIAYPYIIKERQIRQWLYYKCWKSRWKDFMCIYIDYIEKKNLSNDQCCFRVDIWGVYTACLSCNNFFFVCFLFFLWMKNSLWGLCMKAAICCTWANNCVYKLWSSLTEYDRAKFLTVSIPNCGLFAFQCFLLCTCKKCVWIKIHQTETHFALSSRVNFFWNRTVPNQRSSITSNADYSSWMPFMKTAGTTLWIYSSAYIYLYMNMFK